MKKLTQSGFTLIEMLIVIGILAVLAVALLFTLNPGDAQKRTRDSDRLKDAAALQTIITQYLDDGMVASACLTSTTGCASNATQKACATNWLNINVCKYAGSVPADPLDGQASVALISGSSIFQGTPQYVVRVSSGDYAKYEVNVRQESAANSTRITTDGGTRGDWYETGSDLNLL